MKRLSFSQFFRGLRGTLRGKVSIPDSLKENETLKVLLERRSMRKFTEQEIPAHVMTAILEAGRVAPCGVNLQCWSFGLYDREQWRDTFGTGIPFHGNRAVIILGDAYRIRAALTEFPHKPTVEYTLAVMNASIAAYAMNIAAEACGVMSVMLSETGKTGIYDAAYLKEKLELPDGVFPLMTIVFGYPSGKPLGMPPKLPLDEIVFTGKYREPDKEVMNNWLLEMRAAYRAAKITSSFTDQLDSYKRKINEAERELKDMVYYKEEEFI